MGVDEVNKHKAESTGADSLIRACAWLALLLASYGIWVMLGNNPGAAARWWISSDSLYPVHVFIDTVLEGNPFSGWKFSIAPCWFPDLVLTALFMALTRNPIAATLLAGSVQTILLVLGLRWIAKAAGWRPGLLADVAAVTSATVVALYVSGRPGVPGVYGQFFLPQTHVGSLILTLFAVATGLRALRPEREGWHFGAYGILCFLGGFSDLMFVVQTLVPLSAVLALASILRLFAAGRAALVAGVGWITASGGYAVNRFFINTTDPSAQSDRRIGQALHTFVTGFVDALRGFDFAHWVGVLWVFVALGVTWWAIRRRDGLTAAAVGTLGLAGLSSAAAVILGGSMTLTTLRDYPSTLRYLHPAFLLPLIALPFVLAAALERTLRRPAATQALAGLLAAGTLLPSVAAARADDAALPPITEYRPPLTDYLDDLARKEGLKVGVAGYWQARPITLLSREGTRAYAVTPAMEPFLWVSNAEWYRALYESERPQVDFVVLDDPLFRHDAPRAHEVFGTPRRTTTFQDVRVLLYRCRTCQMSPEERAATWMDEPLTQFDQQLSSAVQRLTLHPGQETTVPITVRNPGTEAWSSAGKRPVNLTYKILRNGNAVVPDGLRTKLPSVLRGGAEATIQAALSAPGEPGSYTVRFSLVQETVVWLMDRSGRWLDLPLEVR